MPSQKGQFRSLQAGRAIAAFLVLLHHAAYFMGVPPQLWYRPRIFTAFLGMKIGVEIFFVLSGIVIFMAHQRDIGNASAVLGYLGKRARRIYPIYWIVLASWLPLYVHFSSNVEAFVKDPQVIVSSILLVHWRDLQTELAVSWTLYHEVLFYFVFSVLLVSRKIGSVIFALWIVLSLPAIFFFHSPMLCDYLFSPLHILFALGFLVVKALQRNWIRNPRTCLIAGIAVLVACMGLAPWLGNASLTITQSAGVGSALLFAGAMALERTGTFSLPLWLCFIGDASYVTYLIHWPVMTIVSKMLYPRSLAHGLPLWVSFVSLVVVSQSVGCILHIVVERPMLQWLGGFRHAGRIQPPAMERNSSGGI